MSIERIVVAALGRDRDEITAPPERVLEVEVIDGIALLTMRAGDLAEGHDPNEYFIEVPAMSLKRALDTAIDDSTAPKPRRLGGPPTRPAGTPT